MKIIIAIAAAGFGGIAAIALTTPAALAIDCGKAVTGSETAICGDPGARAADDAMVAAFTQAVAGLPPAQHKVFVHDQAEWIKERDIDCTSSDDGQQADKAAVAACVVRETDARRRFLLGLPDAGPGADGAIKPVIVEGAQGFLTSFDFVAPKTRAELLFNATLDKQLKRMHLARSDSEADYQDSLDVHLTYASPDFMSVNVDGTYADPRYAHPMPVDYNLNIDMKTGTRLDLPDAFEPATLARLQKECLGQLKNYLADPDGSVGDVDPELIKTDLADLDYWRFGGNAATIVFDPVDSDPSGVCSFPYAELRPLVKPTFPLPH